MYKQEKLNSSPFATIGAKQTLSDKRVEHRKVDRERDIYTNLPKGGAKAT